jgi:zinc protease
MTWLIPGTTSPDYPALEVAAGLLGAGESSRLHQSLVYRKRIAQDTSADTSNQADGGTLLVTATMATGHKPAEAEAAMLAEIELLEKKPIPAAELEKAKTNLLTKAIKTRETNEGKAISLGAAVIFYGSAAAANSYLAALQAVTAEDVQRVLKQYVTDRHKVVIEYQHDPVAATAGDKK